MARTFINYTLVLLFVSNFLWGPCFGQSKILTKREACECSTLIERIAKGWKDDSLAGNGYRLAVYKSLLECELDSFDVKFLRYNLGKPTEEVTYMSGTKAYKYNYYDYKHIDLEKSKQKGFGWNFLIFSIDPRSNKVMRISKGTGEY